MLKNSKIVLAFVLIGLLLSGCGGGGEGEKGTTPYAISGQVTTLDGLAGVAKVTINLSGGYNGSVTTDGYGKWTVNGLKGTVTVTPFKLGCSFDNASQTVSQTSVVNFKVSGFSDLFDNVASGWANSSSPEYSFSYLTNEYEMKITAINTLYVSQAPVNTSDSYSVEVGVYLASGSANAKYGVMFNDGENFFYGFRINAESPAKYQIFKHFGEGDNYYYCPDWTVDSHIQSGTNILKVQQKGAQASFYINGNLVNTITVDTHITKTLRVGLLVGSYNTAPAIVRFTNFKLTSDAVSASGVPQVNSLSINNINKLDEVRSYPDK